MTASITGIAIGTAIFLSPVALFFALTSLLPWWRRNFVDAQ